MNAKHILLALALILLAAPTTSAETYHLADNSPAAQQAAQRWETTTNTELFTPTAPLTIQINARPMNGTTGAIAGWDWYTPLSTHPTCRITTNSNLNLSYEYRVRVLTHELGHCFGLDHSTHGIMQASGLTVPLPTLQEAAQVDPSGGPANVF